MRIEEVTGGTMTPEKQETINKQQLSFATFNLRNLNEPELPINSNNGAWDAETYHKKIQWSAAIIASMDADIWGFQEV